jgi:HAD superfamily hydrolase (TIGR01509 family)
MEIMPMPSQHYIRLLDVVRPLHAIAFDLDSTLTRPYLDFRKLREQLNLPEGDILQWLEQLPPVEKSQAQALIEAFEQDGVANVEWNDGAQETFEAVRKLGLPVAIVTRNSRASLVAACRHLDIVVEVLVAREDAPPKPHPASIHHTASQLGVSVSHLLMVGDYRHDIDAGRAAGAMTALLTNGHLPTWSAEVQADLTIARLDELLDYLAVEQWR